MVFGSKIFRACAPPRIFAALVLAAAVRGAEAPSRGETWRRNNPVWRGVHLLAERPESAAEAEAAVPGLAAAGVNVIVFEVDYHFAFEGQPRFRAEATTGKAEARSLAAACRRHGIRLVPQFQCLGHQSWAGMTFPLLTQRPEFDETPGLHPGNKGIYCRSWCPRHPQLHPVVFGLMDEIAEAFEADALHVGMDEVFLLASESCPRCRGADPAAIFADEVRAIHDHLHLKGLEMMMWADRLLDGRATGLGEWEAAKNGTAPALNQIPKDIILCDWHYEPLDKYPGKPASYVSLRLLLNAGFRVWPTGWKNPAAAADWSRFARDAGDARVVGYLCSTWGAVKTPELHLWPPLVSGFAPWRSPSARPE